MTIPEIRCGLLGPGRTRNGLGPFLARWLERAGLRVVAVAGRDLERTRACAIALERDLGHAIDARDGLAGLLAARDLDALVVAAPPEAHLPALRAALDADLHVLCEKPLVAPGEEGAVEALCSAFVRADRVLVENCQWPETLAAFDALYPGARRETPRRLDMRLSPSGRGLAMLTDSLSHYLSMLQAVAPVDASTVVEECLLSTRAPDAERVVVRLAFARPFGELRGTLELEHVREQPRPAWYEIDGMRLDRRVRVEDYSMVAVGGGREQPMDDPLGRLVYGFADAVRGTPRSDARRHADAARHRARLYGDIVVRWCSS